MTDSLTHTVNQAKISIIQGDITKQTTDAIVNAANSGLRGGGGVDGAIHRAGGPAIMEECRKIGGCPTGSAVITTGGRLHARKVIHAVGPVWHGGSGSEEQMLASAYCSSLELAAQNGLRTIAFPSISTGAYGYPIGEASRVALAAVLDYLKAHPGQLDVVRFVLFSSADCEVYEQALEELAPAQG